MVGPSPWREVRHCAGLFLVSTDGTQGIVRVATLRGLSVPKVIVGERGATTRTDSREGA
ncbi:hypothetical protein RSK60_3230002 [Ralstonia solanacearum K60]|nr:hypothetical protein RSK60_3230002 [Ralstonia solanacearum K60]